VTTIDLPINIHVTIGLPFYGNGVPIQQPIRVNAYLQPRGKPPGGLPNGGLPIGGSSDQYPHGGPPRNPPVGFYGWQALDPRILMPPWYQPVPILFEPTNKLPYRKLQYPTYMKDINLDAHIKVFKKMIRAIGEIVEANIINLFGFTLQDNI
jgi:hypothetical protein